MAKEATIRIALQVRSGMLNYQSNPTYFSADIVDPKGPTPGAFTVSVAGTDTDLSELTEPGLCRIMNLDSTNFVEFGIWDPALQDLFVLGELLPGETYVLRLSRNLGETYEGTGTGTTAPTRTLRFKADTAPCVVLVEAFER